MPQPSCGLTGLRFSVLPKARLLRLQRMEEPEGFKRIACRYPGYGLCGKSGSRKKVKKNNFSGPFFFPHPDFRNFSGVSMPCRGSVLGVFWGCSGVVSRLFLRCFFATESLLPRYWVVTASLLVRSMEWHRIGAPTAIQRPRAGVIGGKGKYAVSRPSPHLPADRPPNRPTPHSPSPPQSDSAGP